MNGIGTLREDSLHAALKAWYARPGDQMECAVDGYVIDLVRDDLLIEIQTGNFAAIKPKLRALLDNHPVRLVYPIASEKWVVRTSGDGATVLGRRKSPKHGQPRDVFRELVRIPTLMRHPHLSLEVLTTHEEVVWQEDGLGSWRRKGVSVTDRCLLEVVSRSVFTHPDDFRILIPHDLPEVFTVPDLTELIRDRHIAQKMAYSLRRMGVIEVVGKRGRAPEYQATRVSESS